jgi:hypothetical protein
VILVSCNLDFENVSELRFIDGDERSNSGVVTNKSIPDSRSGHSVHNNELKTSEAYLDIYKRILEKYGDCSLMIALILSPFL